MAITLVTPDIRCSFVHLAEARAPADDAKPRYSIVMMFDREVKAHRIFIKKLREAIRATVVEKWGEEQADKIIKKFKYPVISDGDDSADDYPEFANHDIVSATNTRRVPVYDRRVESIDVEDLEEVCYSGAWYRAEINLYAWGPNIGGRGVSIGLLKVQKRKDDEAFGNAGRPADEVFEADEADEDEDETPKPSKRKARRADEDETPKPSKRKARRADEDDEDDEDDD